MHALAISMFVAISLAASAAGAEGKKPAPPSKAPTAISLTVEYQRVGRDLLKLREQRGFFDVGDLVPRFRAIKLDIALASSASRAAMATALTEIAAKIERMRGIRIEQACLENPLAPSCQ